MELLNVELNNSFGELSVLRMTKNLTEVEGGLCTSFGAEKLKRRFYKILKQKNVFICPGIDRSVFLKCLEIMCVLRYGQLAHQKQVASSCEKLSENEVKESGSFLTDKAPLKFSQVSFPLRFSLLVI